MTWYTVGNSTNPANHNRIDARKMKLYNFPNNRSNGTAFQFFQIVQNKDPNDPNYTNRGGGASQSIG